MRQITDVLTCDVCGKTKVTPYIHIGVEMKTAAVMTNLNDARVADANRGVFVDDEFYEIRSTQHRCGKCFRAVYSASQQN